jgi:hypothetical protein
MGFRLRLVLWSFVFLLSASCIRAQDFLANTAGTRSAALGGTYVISSVPVRVAAGKIGNH